MKNSLLGVAWVIAVLFALPAASMSLFVSCEGGSDESRPEWTKEGYSLSGYYVGVGVSDQEGKSRAEQRKESELLAKQHLAEQIQVTVIADNEQITTQNNQRVRKDAQSKVTVRAEEMLRGMKLQGSWIDKESCTQYTLMVISKKSVEQARLEKTVKSRFEIFKKLLEQGENRNKNRDINDRRKELEDAQALLKEIDFHLLTDLGDVKDKAYFEKQLGDALAALDKETSDSSGRMALFALNKDHSLNDSVIGKMVDQLRAADQSADRLMADCEQESDCINIAKERGFKKLTMLIASCQVGVSQMGSLKGKLTVMKKIYDLDSRKVLDSSHTMSAEVIGWSNEELDWNAAAEKVMLGLK